MTNDIIAIHGDSPSAVRSDADTGTLIDFVKRCAPAGPAVDTWLDELQWLAGFPVQWGEPHRRFGF